jgi:hypothetical protein
MPIDPSDFPIDPYVIDGVELAAILNRIFPDGVPAQDGPTGAVKVPSGTTAQRPATPAEGNIRYNTTTQQYEGFRQGQWASLGGDSIPLFSTFWFPNRAAIPAGFVVADGQVLNRATYPDAWAGIAANNVPLAATDAAWLATNTERGKYTVGNGTSTFRLPDYNGKSSGSTAAPVLRGDGASSAGTNGLIQLDQIAQHTHFLNADGTITVSTSSTIGGAGANSYPVIGNTPNAGSRTGFPNVEYRQGVETRMVNVTGCFAVKLFGAVINVGSADAAQLASDLANLTAAAYQKSNILGTVSQISGVPTGAIIEAGSNGSGEFVKFADGTMICTRNVSLGVVPVTTAAGSLFTAISGALPFAATFSGAPKVHISAIAPNGAMMVSGGSTFPATTATQPFALLSPTSSNASVSVQIIAVGRWF